MRLSMKFCDAWMLDFYTLLLMHQLMTRNEFYAAATNATQTPALQRAPRGALLEGDHLEQRV